MDADKMESKLNEYQEKLDNIYSEISKNKEKQEEYKKLLRLYNSEVNANLAKYNNMKRESYKKLIISAVGLLTSIAFVNVSIPTTIILGIISLSTLGSGYFKYRNAREYYDDISPDLEVIPSLRKDLYDAKIESFKLFAKRDSLDEAIYKINKVINEINYVDEECDLISKRDIRNRELTRERKLK